MQTLLQKLISAEKKSASKCLIFGIKIKEYYIQDVNFEKRLIQKDGKVEYVDLALPTIKANGNFDGFEDKSVILNKPNRTHVYINEHYEENYSANPYFGYVTFEGPWIENDPSYLVVNLHLEGESIKYVLDCLKNGIFQEEYLTSVGFRLGITNTRIDKNRNFVTADINFLQMGPREKLNG
jgi:hypothetical protein